MTGNVEVAHNEQFAYAQRNNSDAVAHTQTGNGNGNVAGRESAYREWLHNRQLRLVSIAAIGGCSTSTASRWRKEWKGLPQ